MHHPVHRAEGQARAAGHGGKGLVAVSAIKGAQNCKSATSHGLDVGGGHAFSLGSMNRYFEPIGLFHSVEETSLFESWR